MFRLCSDITIGGFRFAGVHEVRIQNSLHSYVTSAYIKVPSITTIISGKRSSPLTLITASQFNDGDPVTINLGYNDRANIKGAATPLIAGGDNNGLCTMYQGFVKRRDMNMPLEIECEGYVRLMRLNVCVNGFYEKIMASDLLKLISKACPAINVVAASDMPLHNITLNEANGADICDKIKELSQGVMTIFFINPTTLWMGLTYTPYSNNLDPFGLGSVSYRLGYNVIKDNSLKERVSDGEPVQVIINGMLATGEKITTASETKFQGRKVNTLVNNIGDTSTLQALANEKQYQMNYAGYEGYINSFLQPYVAPGFKAKITDDRYPERDGVYMVDGTDVTFGRRGARIKVEIGPKIGFNPGV